MEIGNGCQYESNYARAAAYFLGTCAERPCAETEAAAYDFLTGLYAGIRKNPEAYGFRPLPDVWFRQWEPQRERQKDVKTIRNPIAKLEALIAELYDFVRSCNVSDHCLVPNATATPPSKRLLTALRAAGVGCQAEQYAFPAGCAAGLQTLAEIAAAHPIAFVEPPKEDKSFLLFSRCVFAPESDWIAAAFDRMMHANGQLRMLCRALAERGYQRVDWKDVKRLSVDFVKPDASNAPVKMAWADKVHFGIECAYEDLQLEPYGIFLRMAGYASVLKRWNDYPSDVTAFLLDGTKTCDGCRYCVQTDKTGTRPLAAVSVNGVNKCPFFPSFSLNWRTVSPERAQQILAVLDAVTAKDA